ncbi:MAG: energy transducer TonB [Candidatus Eisenbacteria bacterium]
MSERPSYSTTTRRGRDRRYRSRIVWSTAWAVVFHLLLVLAVAPLRDRIPLVRRSGYRGEIRLLPEISVMRDAAETENEALARGGELGGSGFQLVELRIAELALPRKTSTEADVEELDPALGDDVRNLRDTSHPQPTGQEIVIEHLVEPVYPQSAIEAGIEGVAVFGIRVEATGEVHQAWLVESEVSGECNLEAQRALLQWRFAPYLVDGSPAPFLKYYRVRFRLTDELREAREARVTSESRPLQAPRQAP